MFFVLSQLSAYNNAQAHNHYIESKDPTLQDSSLVPDEFEDNNHHHALAMDHYTLAYGMFLEGKDVFPEEEKILEARYGAHRWHTV